MSGSFIPESIGDKILLARKLGLGEDCPGLVMVVELAIAPGQGTGAFEWKWFGLLRMRPAPRSRWMPKLCLPAGSSWSGRFPYRRGRGDPTEQAANHASNPGHSTVGPAMRRQAQGHRGNEDG